MKIFLSLLALVSGTAVFSGTIPESGSGTGYTIEGSGSGTGYVIDFKGDESGS